MNANGNGHRPTNRELAQTDVEFRAACEAAGVYPSRTAYRKWKWGRGAARAFERALLLDKSRATHIVSDT